MKLKQYRYEQISNFEISIDQYEASQDWEAYCLREIEHGRTIRAERIA